MDLTATRFDTEAVQAAPGLVTGTMVRTLDGLLPVEFLCSGDRIVCRSGARRLLAVTSWQASDVDLVLLRVSTLGHDRPAHDLVVTASQPVLIRDWRAKALYGQPVAAIPAARLVDGEFILTETRTDARLFALHFADDEVIYAAGLELVCPVQVSVQVPQMATLSA